MRHNKKINHLGRTGSHREAMLSNMAASLIKHKRIFTTTVKAKALRKFFEPLVTKSKDDTTHSRREVFATLQDKVAVTELFTKISEKVETRPGGYTRIIKTGNRLGDNAAMCFIELVDYNENMLKDKKKATSKTRRSRKKSTGATAEDAPATTAAKAPKTPKAPKEPVAITPKEPVDKAPTTSEKVVQVVEEATAEITSELESIIAEAEEAVAQATKAVEKKPEVVETAPEVVEAAPEVVEAAPEVVEAAPEVVEAAPEVVEAVAEPAVIESNPEEPASEKKA